MRFSGMVRKYVVPVFGCMVFINYFFRIYTIPKKGGISQEGQSINIERANRQWQQHTNETLLIQDYLLIISFCTIMTKQTLQVQRTLQSFNTIASQIVLELIFIAQALVVVIKYSEIRMAGKLEFVRGTLLVL